MRFRKFSHCVIVSVLLAAATTIGAQRPAGVLRSPPSGYRDPRLATAFSVVIPGGGQLYAGRTGKGALLLTGFVASAVISIDGANHPCGTSRTGVCANSSAYWLGIVGEIGTWVYGWATAASDAREHNDNLTNGRVGLVPVIETRNGRTLAGLSFSPR